MSENPNASNRKLDAGDKAPEAKAENDVEKAKKEIDESREDFQSQDNSKSERKYDSDKPRTYITRERKGDEFTKEFHETLKKAQEMINAEQRTKLSPLKSENTPAQDARESTQNKLCIAGNSKLDLNRVSRSLELPALPKSESQLDKTKESERNDAQRSTLDGELKAPDGRSIRIEKGVLKDSTGQTIAELDEKGQIKKAGSGNKSDINSEYDGWTFVGNDGGKHRGFVCDRSMSSGRMFLELDPKTRLECDVRMGMVIDRKSGEQLAILSAPTDSGGKLNGGKLHFFETPPGEVALADMKNSSFDLALMGQTGVESRRIQGLSMGSQKLADGRPDPDTGGLFNVQEGLVLLSRHQDELKAKLQDSSEQEKSQRMALELTQMHTEALHKLIKTGEVGNFSAVKHGVEQTRKSDDPVLAAKQLADSKEERLEALPDDMSKMNGSIKLAAKKTGEQDTHIATYKIKDGVILDTDEKPLFRVSNEQGQMILTNLKTNERSPAQSLSGAVWNMSYPGSDGNIQWISHGDRFVSRADLERRSENSINYAQILKAKSESDDSSKRLQSACGAQIEYLAKLDKLFTNGITQPEDLKWIGAGPIEVHNKATERTDSSHSATEARSQKRIDIPVFVSDRDKADASENKFSVSAIKEGKLRIGSEIYEIGAKGQLSQNGKPVGFFKEGYQAEIHGRKVDLANTNRVLMQFALDGDSRTHKIMSLGPERVASDGAHIQGGLVHHDQLLREGLECRQKAREGDREYFAKKPYLNTWLAMKGIADFDSFDKDLNTFAKNIDTQVANLSTQIDSIFDNGFKQEFDNNKVDATIRSTQHLVSGLSFTSISSEETARDSLAAQKQANDAMVTGVITVVTGGLGSWAAAGRAAETMTVATQAGRQVLWNTAKLAGTSGATAGGLISAAGRMSAQSNDGQNFVSGSLEGMSNALGSVGGAWLNAAKGRELGTAAEFLYRSSEAVAQTAVNSLAGAIREGDPHLMNMKSLLAGSMTQLGTAYLGVGLGKLSQRLAAGLSERLGDNLTEAAKKLGLPDSNHVLKAMAHDPDTVIAALQKNGFSPERLKSFNLENSLLRGLDTISDAANAGATGFANGFCGAIPAGLDAQREKIAAKYGINISEVKGDLFEQNIDYSELANYCKDSGLDAMQTAIGTSAISRPVNTHIEAGADHEGRKAVAIIQFRESAAAQYKAAQESIKQHSVEGGGSLVQRLKNIKEARESLEFEPGNEYKSTVQGDQSTILESNIHSGRIELDENQRISEMIDATGKTLSVDHDDAGNLLAITSYDGEAWMRTNDGWEWNKNGATATHTDLVLHNDGTIQYNVHGHLVTRKLDGSVRDSAGRLVDANLPIEQGKIRALIAQLPESTDKKFAQVMLDAIPTRLGLMGESASKPGERSKNKIGWSDHEMAATLHEVSEILRAKDSKLSESDRAGLVVEIMGNILDANSIVQGAHPTCNATDVSFQMFSRCPSEAVRLIKEAVNTGEVNILGESLKLSRHDLSHDPQTRAAHAHELFQERVNSSGEVDYTHRNLSDKILQTVILNAHWMDKTHGANREDSVARGSMRWEHDAKGNAVLKHDGVRVSDSPNISTEDLSNVYRKITFRNDSRVIAHDEVGVGITARFKDEYGFLSHLREAEPSQRNPITIFVNCSAEPFYTESNAAITGGSHENHVVNIVGGPFKQNGEEWVYVSNTWSKSTQHTQNEGTPIKLHDLYLASMPIDSAQRIDALAVEAASNPFRYMEHLRALEESGHSLARLTAKVMESNDKVLPPEVVAEEMRKEHNRPTISQDEHLLLMRNLKDSLEENNAWEHLGDEQRQKAIDHAAATIRRLEKEISNPSLRKESNLSPDSPFKIPRKNETEKEPEQESSQRKKTALAPERTE